MIPTERKILAERKMSAGKKMEAKKLNKYNIARVLEIGSRWFLGIIFIWASIDKIVHPQGFARIIFNYQILPVQLVNITAIFLPWLELVAGICLITGIWLHGATVICLGLLAAFFGSLIFCRLLDT